MLDRYKFNGCKRNKCRIQGHLEETSKPQSVNIVYGAPVQDLDLELYRNGPQETRFSCRGDNSYPYAGHSLPITEIHRPEKPQ
jgi:hypothetical protein